MKTTLVLRLSGKTGLSAPSNLDDTSRTIDSASSSSTLVDSIEEVAVSSLSLKPLTLMLNLLYLYSPLAP